MFKNRDLYNDIVKHLSRKEYSIITGARQTGKTTLLLHLFEELKLQNRKVFYINFDNPEILNDVNNHPENIFKYCIKPANPLYENEIKKPSELIILLIDEVQYASNPSNFLKYLYDTYRTNLKIIATGSSAFYIDKKFTDSLAGRKKIFQIWTLSFDEFLDFKEASLLKKELNLIRQQSGYISSLRRDIILMLEEYLNFGGYPEVVLEKDIKIKKEILSELRNSYIRRDLLESGITNEIEFYKLMTLLSGQIGNLVNKNELSRTIGIDNKTIDNYLYILRKCFHIELLRPFTKNLRNELSKMPKIYFNDLGLRNALLNRFFKFDQREDKGALIENYFYLKLRNLYDSDSIKFWRTADGNEVDFIVTTEYNKGFAYEVKYNETDFKRSKYKKFEENYSGFKLEYVSLMNSKKYINILNF